MLTMTAPQSQASWITSRIRSLEVVKHQILDNIGKPTSLISQRYQMLQTLAVKYQALLASKTDLDQIMREIWPIELLHTNLTGFKLPQFVHWTEVASTALIALKNTILLLKV